MTTGFDRPRPEVPGYVPVPWSFLARLDEVPCDVFIRAGRRIVLYATTGTDPDSLRDRASKGADLVVRQGDSYLLRRMLTVSLDRTLKDQSTPPQQRSREAYEITATIVAQTFRMGRDGFDGDEAALVQETVDLLTNIVAVDDETLWSMVASMQRQLTTHTHAINAAIFGLALAKKAGLTDMAQMKDLARGALLMDLGLTTLPSRIVERPNGLEAQEARALRQHPAIGYSIVTRAVGETPSYAHIILEHHERLDGSGYPAGRKASQLALDSQLVAIVDAFDALTSNQGTTVGMSPYAACQQLRFGMPGQFNDELLRIFIDVLGGWPSLRIAS
jgi:HD-GYP domain-containing protein (c-di-GMP phosphodiesterase class II)